LPDCPGVLFEVVVECKDEEDSLEGEEEVPSCNFDEPPLLLPFC